LDIKKALVICGHPDDEVLGLGGTIRKLVNHGVEVFVLMFANGNEGYTSLDEKESIVTIRRTEREKVQKILGISAYEAYDYGDYEIPANETTYKICIKAIRKYKPEIVFTHDWKEYMAHKNVASIATEAFWQAGWVCSLDLGEPWRASSLFHFEVIQLLDTVSHIVDITEAFNEKIQAMEAYASQCGVVSGALQQIVGKAMLRGAQAGVRYGEGLLQNMQLPRIIGHPADFL
jgi:N,N'-diacetylchitobiose non-reducing end deacetylase